MFFYIAFSFFGFLFFIYLKKCNQFWKNQGVPSTSPSLFFGDSGTAIFCVTPVYRFYEDIYNAFPEERYVGFYEFLKPLLLIRDPKLIESVFVKDFSYFSEHLLMKRENSVAKNLAFVHSKDWKYVRGKLTTNFSANKLKGMLVLMNKSADILDSVLSENCKYEAVKVKNIFARYTVDMITSCFFGLNSDALTKPESQVLRFCQSILKPSMASVWLHFLRNILPDFHYWVITHLPTSKDAQSVDDMITKNDEMRKSGSAHSKNLLQMMLDLRDLNRQKTLTEENVNDVIIDDAAVKSSMLVVFLGTFEGSANALTFCLYELALHPESQQRLRHEVLSILEANQGVLDYDSLKKMSYAEMVINEILRMHSSPPLLRRACNAPYKMPDSTLTLNVGQIVTIPVHAIHHDEKYYPNPKKFDPDRFTPENIASRPPFTFLAFADGPRMCPGERFARMNLKLLLARILSKYEVCPCSKTEIPVILDAKSPFCFPKNPVQLRIKKL